MAQREHSKPPADGVRGVFLMVFLVLVGGIFLLCWLMVRNTQLGDRLTGVQAEQAQGRISEGQRPSQKSHGDISEGSSSDPQPEQIALAPPNQPSNSLAKPEAESPKDVATDDNATPGTGSDTVTALPQNDSALLTATGVRLPDDPNFGLILGDVVLNGKPPPPTRIDAISHDPNCGKLHPDPAQLNFYAVDTDGHLADVFVYLSRHDDSPDIDSYRAPDDPVIIDQARCQYSPYVVAMQKGNPIQVNNSDPVLHNIHFVPAVAGNKESNKAQMPKSDPILYSFAKAEPFLKLKCDVHPWMFAYVCVADNPFFAITDKRGAFRIPHVPPGHYELVAIHRKAGRMSDAVFVKALSTSEPIYIRFIMTVKP